MIKAKALKAISELLTDAMRDIRTAAHMDAHVRLDLALYYAQQLPGDVITNRVRRAFIAQAIEANRQAMNQAQAIADWQDHGWCDNAH
jgi:hypothetical protein